jgi:N6-adenosine-specific RNA methylase IME4
MTLYNVILADPPWSFHDRNSNGKRGACHKYETMTIDDIKALRPKIDSLASEDCALFLWCPAPLVAQGVVSDVMTAWGFTPKTEAFCWIKTQPTKPMQVCGINLALGLGHYTRSNVESCWLGIRGKPKIVSRSVQQVIFAHRREHSRKPDEIYHRIEQLYGDVPRVELFARQRWPGWDQAISNEPERFEKSK